MKSILFSPIINKKDRRANFLIKRFNEPNFFACPRVTLNRKSIWHGLKWRQKLTWKAIFVKTKLYIRTHLLEAIIKIFCLSLIILLSLCLFINFEHVFILFLYRWSLFLIKLQALRHATQVLSTEICKIFQNTYF